MFDPDILADLMAAEAKIKQLNQNDIQAAEEAAFEINQLLESIDELLETAGFNEIGKVPDDPANAELLDQIRQKINEASDTYNGLTADQKKLIDQLDQDSDALDNLLSVISDYKEAFPNDDSIVEPKMASLIENCTITTPAVTYTGGDLTPAVTVRDGNKTLTKDKDYTVKYTNNRNVGPGKVTVRGKGDYTGEATGTFSINPKGTTLSKPKRAKKAFTAKWKKQTAKMSISRITGYQIQYSLKKNFKSKTKTVTVNGYNSGSKKIGKLKKKKTYYVKIRTFMRVDGKTYYSGWSGVKKVKTK